MQISFGTLKVSGYSAYYDFAASFALSLDQSNPIVTYATQQDCNVKVTTAASSKTDYVLQLTGIPEAIKYTLTSLTPAICSITAGGKIKYVSTGTGKVAVTCLYGTREYSLDVKLLGGASIVSTVSHVAGSVGANVEANIAALTSGKLTPGSQHQNLWTSAIRSSNPDSCAAVKNPYSIVADLDLSFVSFTQEDPIRYPCMLISSRHALVNTHVAGSWYVFRKPDGSFVRATVKSSANLGHDLTLLYFNETINGITPMRVLDSTFIARTPTLVSTIDANGVLTMNQRTLDAIIISVNPSTYLGLEQHAQVISLSSHSYNVAVADALTAVVFVPCASDSVYAGLSSAPYSGDSGSPILLPVTISGNVVPCYVCSLYTASSGPSCIYWKAAVQTAMQSLATAAGDVTVYTLQIADLSAYTAY